MSYIEARYPEVPANAAVVPPPTGPGAKAAAGKMTLYTVDEQGTATDPMAMLW